MAVLSTEVVPEDGTCESSYETAFIVLDHLVVVVLEELRFEVGQIETTVVVCSELVGKVQNDLVRVKLRHECLSH